jgi:hypothetical protein
MNNLNVKFKKPIEISTNQFLQLLEPIESVEQLEPVEQFKPKKINRFDVIQPNNHKHLITFQSIKADGITPTAFKNILNNEVSMEWEEFKKIIQPTPFNDKTLLPAMIPASLKELIISTVTDNEGVDHPRRCAENIDLYYALFLDFDGELQIDDFVKNHTDLEYILYTTSSSTKEINRFRAIIPLLNPVAHKEIATRKKGLFDKFNLSKDESTFSCSRLFYLPSSNSEIYFNSGEFFDLEKKIQAIIPKPKPKPIQFKQQSVESIRKNQKRLVGYLDKMIIKHHHKLHHPDLFSIVGAMQSEGLDNIIDVVIKDLKDPASSFNLENAKRTVDSESYSGGTLAHYAKGC